MYWGILNYLKHVDLFYLFIFALTRQINFASISAPWTTYMLIKSIPKSDIYQRLINFWAAIFSGEKN